jgi:hypothetical protein
MEPVDSQRLSAVGNQSEVADLDEAGEQDVKRARLVKGDSGITRTGEIHSQTRGNWKRASASHRGELPLLAIENND